jgi:hypothetical protein
VKLLEPGEQFMADTSEQDLNEPPIKTRDELIERLARNRQRIKGGSARFNGIPINSDTVLTQFVRVTSLLFFISTQSGAPGRITPEA